MSQVKKIQKFSGGGEVVQSNTPPKAKGKFVFGNKEFEANDEFINKFTTFAQSQTDVDQSVYRDILNEIEKGNTISYDPLTNELSGLKTVSSLNARQNRKVERHRTGFGEFTASIGGESKVNRVQSAVHALKSFDANPIVKPEQKAALPIIDVSKKRTLNYDKNDKGENVWLQTLENQDALNTLSNIQNAFNLHAANDGSATNNYDIKGFDFSTGYDLHSKNPNLLNDVIGRLQSGKLTNADKEYIKGYNIHLNSQPSTSDKTTEELELEKIKAESKTNALSLGINVNENDRANEYIYKKDNKGNILIYDNSGNPVDKEIITENSPFWSKDSKYNKGVILGGRTYTLSQLSLPEYNPVASVFKPYKDYMLSGNIADAENFAKANGINTWTNEDWIKRNEDGSWTDTDIYKQGEAYLPQYESFFGSPEFIGASVRLANITGAVEGLSPTQTLIRYLAHNKDTSRNVVDEWGRIRPNYVIHDSATGKFINNVDVSALGVKPSFNQSSHTPISWLKSSEDTGYWEDSPLIDKAKKVTYRVVRPKSDPNSYYIQYNNKFHKVSNIQEFLKKYKNNTNISRTDIESFVDSKGIDAPRKTLGEIIATTQSKSYKIGGKIPMFAQGDKFSGVQQSGSQYNSDRIFEGNLGDITKAATMKDIGNLDLTKSDYLQLGALVGDMTALGASFVGGGNPAAGIIGGASTLTQFASDVTRDGMDAGDWGELAMGLGLDAISLVPGVGISGKMMKTVKLLKRSKNLLSTVFSTAGMVAAGQSLSNLLDDTKEFNADDLRNVLQGVQGVIGFKRAVIDPSRAANYNRKLADIDKNTGKIKDTDAKIKAVEQVQEISFNKLKETPEFAQRIATKTESDPNFAEVFGKRLKDAPETALKELFGDDPIPENITKLVKGITDPSKLKTVAQKGKNIYKSSVSLKNRLINSKPTHDVYTFDEIDAMDIADWRKNSLKKIVANRIGVNPEAYGHRNQYEYVRNSNGKNELVERFGTNYNYLESKFGNDYVRWYNPFTWGTNGSSKRKEYIDRVRKINPNIKLLEPAIQKKGGILKAQVGLKFPDMFKQNDSLTNIGNSALLGKTAPTALDNSINKILPKYTLRNTSKFLPKVENSFQDRVPVDIFSSHVTRGPREDESKVIPGSEAPKNFNYNNLISPDGAMSLAGLIGSGLYNKRIHDVQDKALVDAMSSGLQQPAEIYDNFTTYGIDNAYRQKAIKENQYKPITSDSLISHAIESGMKAQGNQTELEGNMKTAELYSNYDMRNNDLRRRYSEVRTNTTNQNRQMLSQLNMARAENTASKLTNDYQGMNNWLMEKRQNYKMKDNEQKQIRNQMLSNSMNESLSNEKLRLIAPYLSDSNYSDEWDKMSISDKTVYKNNKAIWLNAIYPELIADKYGKAQGQAYNALYGKAFGIDPNSQQTALDIKYKYKFGGRLNRLDVSGSTASNKIWINQNSEIAKAGKLLNQNIMKLFLAATANANKKI